MTAKIDGSPPLARPGAGKTAEEEQQAQKTGKHRQHADAADNARIAHFQAYPVIALVGITGAHREDARQADPAAVIKPA